MRNCSERAISPFPTVFSILLENFLPFSSMLKLSSANSLSLEESTICGLGKGLSENLSFPSWLNCFRVLMIAFYYGYHQSKTVLQMEPDLMLASPGINIVSYELVSKRQFLSLVKIERI